MLCSNRRPSAPRYTRRLPGGRTRGRSAHARCATARPSAPSPDRRRTAGHRPCGARRRCDRADRSTRPRAPRARTARPTTPCAKASRIITGNNDHHRDSHAPQSAAGPRSSPRPPGAPANPPAANAAARPVSNIPVAPRTTINTCAGVSMKCSTTPKPSALEIHHLAADQVGTVKILVVPLRQLAARHAHLLRPAEPAPGPDPRLPATSPSARRRCGRWPRSGSPCQALPRPMRRLR